MRRGSASAVSAGWQELDRDENESTTLTSDTPCTPAGTDGRSSHGMGDGVGRARTGADPGRSPTARLVSSGRPVSGLSSGPPGSRLHPLPAHCAVGAGLRPADAGSTRLPLRGQRRILTGFPFSRPCAAGSPVGACTVGKGARVSRTDQSGKRCASVAVARCRPVASTYALPPAAHSPTAMPHSTIPRHRPRRRARRCRRRSSLLPVEPRDHDQGRQVAGDRGRRRDREDDPRDPRGEIPGRTASTARRRARAHLDAEYVWIVDPIDGTKAFVREYPMFSTQIALMHRGRLIVGVSSAPAYGELAFGEIGVGAWLNDAPIRVSEHRHDRRRSALDRQPEDARDRAALARVRATGRSPEPDPRLRRFPALPPAGVGPDRRGRRVRRQHPRRRRLRGDRRGGRRTFHRPRRTAARARERPVLATNGRLHEPCSTRSTPEEEKNMPDEENHCSCRRHRRAGRRPRPLDPRRPERPFRGPRHHA